MTQRVRVLITVPFKERHLARFLEVAGDAAEFVQVDVAADSNEMRQQLAQAEVVFGEPAPSLLSEGTPVRWVQMTWAGTDLYTRGDIPFPRNTRLTNVAGTAYGHIISQYILAQVLSIAQNLPAYLRQQDKRLWQGVGPVMSLEGARVLIFGSGDIGTKTAQRFQGFETHCIGVCRDTTKTRPFFEELVTLEEAESQLQDADVVVNCLPNTPQTAGYLDERRLRMIKPTAILVNVGRGNFIDCEALARVLADGHLRGAALDVTDPEPLPTDHPLWGESRCVITPHQSGGAFNKCDGTEDRICEVCCENLKRYLSGSPLTHVVL